MCRYGLGSDTGFDEGQLESSGAVVTLIAYFGESRVGICVFFEEAFDIVFMLETSTVFTQVLPKEMDGIFDSQGIRPDGSNKIVTECVSRMLRNYCKLCYCS